jgi:GntR family transcriptional repressor for pyruvate dehydrogenase complex
MRRMSPPAALDLTRLRPLRRTDNIVAQVRELILNGALRPGERLPSERDLARAWQVGRPTVREAIQQLEGLGFVEVRAARGSFVRSLTPQAIEEPLRRVAGEEGRIVAQILDVRMALEGWVAAEAARSATLEQIKRIARIVEDLSAAAERGEPLSAHDAAFHRALVEATGNTVMLHMMESLTSLGASVRAFKKRVGFRQTRPRAFTEHHRRLARALAARDPEAARRAMVAHLEMVKESLGVESAPGRRRAPKGRRRLSSIDRMRAGRRARTQRGVVLPRA